MTGEGGRRGGERKGEGLEEEETVCEGICCCGMVLGGD